MTSFLAEPVEFRGNFYYLKGRKTDEVMSEAEFENILSALKELSVGHPESGLPAIIEELNLYREAIRNSREFQQSNIDIDAKSRKTYRMY